MSNLHKHKHVINRFYICIKHTYTYTRSYKFTHTDNDEFPIHDALSNAHLSYAIFSFTSWLSQSHVCDPEGSTLLGLYHGGQTEFSQKNTKASRVRMLLVRTPQAKKSAISGKWPPPSSRSLRTPCGRCSSGERPDFISRSFSCGWQPSASADRELGEGSPPGGSHPARQERSLISRIWRPPAAACGA